jgi:hypothetical protein
MNVMSMFGAFSILSVGAELPAKAEELKAARTSRENILVFMKIPL